MAEWEGEIKEINSKLSKVEERIEALTRAILGKEAVIETRVYGTSEIAFEQV